MNLDELLTGAVIEKCDTPQDGCIYLLIRGKVICLMPMVYDGHPIIGYSAIGEQVESFH